MSRLDDELKNAFRAEEPSSDFTDRVMKAVAAAPPPKKHWWHELRDRFAHSNGRWVALAVAATLLIALAASQYRKPQVTGQEQARAVEVEPAKPAPTPEKVIPAPESVAPAYEKVDNANRKRRPTPRHHQERLVNNDAQVVTATQPAPKSEGEIAKEKLMLALHIASASLNEAQKMTRATE
ncbi:MAG TPA: hypothetical protein VG778_04655 [Blastocatellia bacterium]|nr:hypothetical protein [Blastocatellia bacterium]